jgi:hypothetical protein
MFVIELQSRRARDRLLHGCGQRSVPAAAAHERLQRGQLALMRFPIEENLASLGTGYVSKTASASPSRFGMRPTPFGVGIANFVARKWTYRASHPGESYRVGRRAHSERGWDPWDDLVLSGLREKTAVVRAGLEALIARRAHDDWLISAVLTDACAGFHDVDRGRSVRGDPRRHVRLD